MVNSPSAGGECSIGELAEPFDMSLPAISKQVRVLEDAGLLVRQRDGCVHRCNIDPEPIKAAVSWLEEMSQLWESRLGALAEYLEQMEESSWQSKPRLEKVSNSGRPVTKRRRPTSISGREELIDGDFVSTRGCGPAHRNRKRHESINCLSTWRKEGEEMMIGKITMTLATVAVASFAFAADHMHQHAPAPVSPAFDKMKALVGDWKAQLPGMSGEGIATYSLHSDGSALVEELKMNGENMVSVYYPTADGVAMTHYCSTHNQPHMVAKGGAQNVSFSEVSVDNLPSKDAEHMKGVDFAFQDADHFTETWTYTSAGKEMPVAFKFARVK